ncbi:MAG: tRNA (adenosine(37)-N6)-threonylcarbamoyltransferase complex dimerization subunit type 1 TsaB [Candidatus Pelagadaptatus aseana]|uniref:tRNA (adenosine(37)-N6)-threonylcarbamoyltransferase complex dimerization subunit type 1 TsaB n=1 Tax=Candidatus Pelagadaptatus aseana TaxID=3120508 RepID=UPI0039B15F65
MSTILAVETSSNLCSVAVLRDGQVFELTEDAPREHTQKLLPMIDALLTDNNLQLADLDAIAYGCGPGSFTGLRICLGVVQGLAYGRDIPLIPVSSLETIARSAAEQGNLGVDKGYLVVANDARMDEVYACFYEFGPDGVVALSEEQVLKPAELCCQSQFKSLVQEFFAIGDGWHYPDLAEVLANREDNQSQCIIKATAGVMLGIAAEKLARGETIAAEQSEPTYLRDSVAWKKRERIRSN